MTKTGCLYIIFRQRNNFFVKIGQKMGRRLHLGWQTNGKATEFVYVAFSGLHSLTLVIGCLLSSWYREGTLFYLFFASKRKEVRIGVSFCSCTRYFSIILIYNAQNTKVAYFEVVNFIPLHLVT